MAEGYILYETFDYASEYIKHIDNTLGVVIWDVKRDEEKREGGIFQTNGKKVLHKE